MNLNRPPVPDPYSLLPSVSAFTVTSHDISDGAPMPHRFVNPAAHPEASNESPHIAWDGFPAQTRSFAVTCFDPDAPTPSGFWHWFAVDVPRETTLLETGAASALPEGAYNLRNDRGVRSYLGPNPPQGDRAHRYYFVVHAVDVDTLEIDQDTTPAVASFNLVFHTLGRAVITPTYSR